MKPKEKNPKGFIRFLFLLSSIFMSGCATPVFSHVTVFNRLSQSNIQDKKIALIPNPPSLGTTLEFATYKDELSRLFEKKGFTVIENPKEADFIGVVTYGIDKGRLVSETYSRPVYGQTGGGTTFSSGTVSDNYGGMGLYNGMTQSSPTFGIVGHSIRSKTYSVYTRFLRIDIFDRPSLDRKKVVKVYEGSVYSQGSCGSLPVVFAPMAKALFKDFYSPNGYTDKIVEPMKGKC